MDAHIGAPVLKYIVESAGVEPASNPTLTAPGSG
jgi:hypothetical protein